MTNAKKILITTESHETFVVRRVGKQEICGFCGTCRAETRMLTLDEAVSIARRDTWNLMSLLESGVVHSVETASGHLLICLQSLGDAKSNYSNTPVEKL